MRSARSNEARTLATRASALGLTVPVAIVYAKSEYETWFIASLSEGTGAGIRARLGDTRYGTRPLTTLKT